jgi:hypothetical protein
MRLSVNSQARQSPRVMGSSVALFLWAFASLACAPPRDVPGTDTVQVARERDSCRFQGAEVAADGRIRIAGGEGETGPTSGTVTCDYPLDHDGDVTTVGLLGEHVPVLQTAARFARWPLAATDIILQARHRFSDGRHGPWHPRNVLLGGDFADLNGNGIPDAVNVLVGDSSGNSWSLLADIAFAGPPPEDFWLERSSIITSADLVANEPNPASARVLRVSKLWTGGGTMSTMTTALLAPSTTWTVSGWTRWDKPPGPDAMARFHEVDRNANLTTKYVLVGDDDFHRPSGKSPWRWRALTFTSQASTTGLSLIPARLTSSSGEMAAAGFEIREGSLLDPAAEVVSEPDLAALDTWEISEPGAARVVASGGGLGPALQLDPAPGQPVSAHQRDPFPLTEGQVYVVTLAMENRASPHYDPTHETWVSCYLEFLDADLRVLDHAKAQVFRPRLEHPVAAAALAPPGTRYGRVLLAALHRTYGPEQLDGTMTALFAGLKVARTSYDPAFQPRPPQRSVTLPREPGAVGVQVRTRLLTRDPQVQPSYSGLVVQ